MNNSKKIIRSIGRLLGILIALGQISSAFADFSCDTVTEISVFECEMLVSFYNNTGGANWASNHGWLSSNSPCSWEGVGCSYGHGEPGIEAPSYIQDIELDYNNLTGSIPYELVNLSNLERLFLSGNELEGSIPKELGELKELVFLRLDANHLTGIIPTELGNLDKLQSLLLNDNELVGVIPVDLLNLTNLDAVDMCNNSLYTTDSELEYFFDSINNEDLKSCQLPLINIDSDQDKDVDGFDLFLNGVQSQDLDQLSVSFGATNMP